jgi:tetratricopeptide (TPR) repeat protein
VNKLAAQAEAATRAGRADEAEKLLLRIARLEPGFSKNQLPAPQQEANRQLFARTFLTLGEISERKNARPQAFVHYRKARQLGAALTSAAWATLAEGYADRQSKSDNALGAYTAYIHEHPFDDSTRKVYSALEAACLVDESKKGAEREQAIELNQRVLAANPNLEWPYYYTAVAYLLDGNLTAALDNLTESQKRNPDRAMTYYWLGACHLQQPGGGNFDAATAALTRFLQFPQESPQVARRQGKAGFELAKRLIDRIGGFDSGADCSTGPLAATLDRAIGYLETAIGRDDAAAQYHFLLGRAYSLRKSSDRAISALGQAAALDGGQKEYHYYLALEFFRAGKLEESRSALNQAIVTDPNYADARELQAQVDLLTGRYEEAEAHCQFESAEAGRAGRVKGILWQALFRQEKYEQVTGEWETGRGDHGPESMYWLARCYTRQRRFEPALEVLQLQPPEPRVVYYSGCSLAALARFDEAKSRFQTLIGWGGEFAFEALLQSGHIHLRTGNIEAAGASYDAALAKQPASAEAHYAMGNLAYRMGEMDIAAEHFGRIPAGEPRYADAQFALGLVSEARGRVADAIARYEVAAKSLNRQELRVRLGVLYCRAGRHVDAARNLEPLAKAGTESDAVLFYLGMALISLDRPAEAADVWSRLLSRHPQDESLAAGLAGAHYLLGEQHTRKQDYGPAIVQWERYLDQFPGDVDTSNDLAELYLRQALHQLASPEAETLIDRALDRDGRNSRAGYYRALRLMKLDRLDECASQLRATLESGGDDPRIRYHLGLCLLLQGQSEEGVRELRPLAAAPQSNGYARYAAWAIANDYIRREQYAEAEAALAGAA